MPAPPDELLAAIRAGRATRYFLLDLDLPAGPVRAWSGVGQLAFENSTYDGVFGLSQIDGASNTADLQAHRLRLTLGRLPLAALSGFEPVVRNAPLKLRLAWLDPSGAGFALTRTVFQGRADYLVTNRDRETVSVALYAVSPLLDLRTPPNAFYSDAEQQERYPDDTGFSQMAALMNKTAAGWSVSTTGGSTIYLQHSATGGFHLTDTALRNVRSETGANFVKNTNLSIEFPGTKTYKGLVLPYLQLAYGTVVNDHVSTIGPAIASADGFVRVGSSKVIVASDRKAYVESNGKLLVMVAMYGSGPAPNPPYPPFASPVSGLDGSSYGGQPNTGHIYTSSYAIADLT